MKSEKAAFAYNPFENLKTLMRPHSVKLSEDDHGDETTSVDYGSDPKGDKDIFLEAMEGTRPIQRKEVTDGRIDYIKNHEPPKTNDEDVLRHLRNLIKRGEGFIISDTPEYVEGTGYGVHWNVAQRLHNGEFSIQSHIDLHGLTAEEAHTTFEGFLKESVMAGKRAVMVIHGRGRSSPSEPIIKNKVVEWLTGGPWRKWVMAFSSARTCDGGAGATYILLRERPVTKRYRKRGTRRAQKNGLE
ncbi:MAG: Smr/MutS family protein [Deltaproteobacteria bacterium]|nr:Smr/MutS family protein [Deltaproteobacteria bacterium]MBN2688144.1 Smr/MutS family protein [Deltaproteobacteria bacterium]